MGWMLLSLFHLPAEDPSERETCLCLWASVRPLKCCNKLQARRKPGSLTCAGPQGGPAVADAACTVRISCCGQRLGCTSYVSVRRGCHSLSVRHHRQLQRTLDSY